MSDEQHCTLQRLAFKKPIPCQYTGSGDKREFIKRFGVKASEGHLAEDSEEAPQGLYGLTERLRSHSVDYDLSPYAEKGNAIAAYAAEICSDISPDEDPTAIIERVMDRLRPVIPSESEAIPPRKYEFLDTKLHFEPSWLVSNELPTAGAILTDPARRTDDGVLYLAHPMEHYVLMAAVLKSKGLNAYPTRVNTGDDLAPLVLLTDFNGAPITTFGMYRVHPGIVHMDIMSDEAVMGMLHAMRAASMGNRLATDNVLASIRGQRQNMDDISERLSMMADDLFQYCMNWVELGAEKHILLQQTYAAIRGYVSEAEAWKGVRKVLSALPTHKTQEDLFLASRGIVESAPMLPVNVEHIGMLLEMNQEVLGHYPPFAGQIAHAWSKALETAQHTVDVVKHMLDEKLAGVDLKQFSDDPSPMTANAQIPSKLD